MNRTIDAQRGWISCCIYNSSISGWSVQLPSNKAQQIKLQIPNPLPLSKVLDFSLFPLSSCFLLDSNETK